MFLSYLCQAYRADAQKSAVLLHICAPAAQKCCVLRRYAMLKNKIFMEQLSAAPSCPAQHFLEY